VRALLLLAALSVGCAAHREVRPIWFRNAPEDWVPPKQFQTANCKVRDEVVIVNFTPSGRATIRIECRDQTGFVRTVLVDKKTKRVVTEWYW
jgi:hypothetical protein